MTESLCDCCKYLNLVTGNSLNRLIVLVYPLTQTRVTHMFRVNVHEEREREGFVYNVCHTQKALTLGNLNYRSCSQHVNIG